MKCSCCDNGKMKIQATEITSEGRKELPVTYINCVVCGGTGELTEEQNAMVEEERNMWCRCGGEEEFGTTYYDDGQHPQIYKHHWRCNKCKKVVQIG